MRDPAVPDLDLKQEGGERLRGSEQKTAAHGQTICTDHRNLQHPSHCLF